MAQRSSVLNFGCRLNSYEGEAIRAALQQHGRDDILVVNTCAVTAEAEKQARQAIRRLRRENPDKRIVVTGCAAQVNAAAFAAMPEVDHVIGNREKLAEATWRNLNPDAARVAVGDIQTESPAALPAVSHFPGRPRAYLEIQQGCDHRCTFCIIPFGRGNSRSVPMGAVVEEARRLVAKSFAEIVLTGVDLTSYGADLPGKPNLGQLVRKILSLVPDLKRLRISSIDSIEADSDLMRAIAEEARLMPHFHLSVQAGDDMILKRMKRRHLRRDTIAFCEDVRRLRPESAFGADLIAGFPTESEAMFENTRRLIEEAGISYLHVFPFSARDGTPAARMPQLSRSVVKSRAAALRAAGDAALNRRYQSLIGSEQEILAEKPGIGRTRCFAPVKIPATIPPGALTQLRIVGSGNAQLIAA
ncbi:MAG TPA: tRNA (N(6)-L-threonylcarbamoyladenosine(37)-C(2))-methylthiotransferase MtaB [Ferrovibrio sp.]|uniref:tRNA (N(6)-L-threonylcarbamoyladenosine(37)-C(2))- methylthiotransferase MtaB n=1 Tax=Ferrovibrio sp. TaxID=1917215 RepID=UPI002ED53DE3